MEDLHTDISSELTGKNISCCMTSKLGKEAKVTDSVKVALK